MLPILQIGPVALPVPQLCLLLAGWLGLSYAENSAPGRGVSVAALYNLVTIGLLVGLLAARLGYVLQYPGAFIQSPASFFSLNPGLLDTFSGLGVGLIGMMLYGQRARLGFWNTLDVFTPLLAFLAVGLALAHIASGEAFGSVTALPWGIDLWGAKRHPTQFYELVFALGILLFLMWRMRTSAPAGSLFLVFVALQAGARLLLEGFRGDSTLLAGGLRAAQLAAWMILAGALIALDRLKAGTVKEASNG